MKALSVVWKIAEERLPGYGGDTNGLVVIRDLCNCLGEVIESWLMLGMEYLPGQELDSIHIVDTQKCAEAHPDKDRLDILELAFQRALREINPDIVHIHDNGDFCRRCQTLCEEKQIPYIFTAHAFIGRDQGISRIHERDIQWQSQVYKAPNLYIAAVSKALAAKILCEYPYLNKERIQVIQNGTNFRDKPENKMLREKLQFHADTKILICPGKITKLKNQLQIVRAYSMLPQNIKDSIAVIFCGNDRLDGSLQRLIAEKGLTDHLKYAGVISNEEMKEYYSICDGMITASISEGLSIAMLETISYGRPVIMFADLGCVQDLDDSRVVCLARERNDEALAAAIRQWFETDWDKEYIIRCSKQFSVEHMTEQYLSYYKEIIEKMNEKTNKSKTSHEEFWAGDFGDNYIARNAGGNEMIAARTALLSRIFSNKDKIASSLEIGSNIGYNEIALQRLFPDIDMSVVEINEQVAKQCSNIRNVTVYNESIYTYESNHTFDLTFVNGVLIYMDIEKLDLVYQKMYDYSNKYILIIEYYNPTPVNVVYRGNENQMCKRDFCGELMDKYRDLILEDYGFIYHRDLSFPMDDFNWFLLRKPSYEMIGREITQEQS